MYGTSLTQKINRASNSSAPMARRPKTTTHVHRDAKTPGAKTPGAKTDLLLQRHRLLRRSSGFMLARKYR